MVPEFLAVEFETVAASNFFAICMIVCFLSVRDLYANAKVMCMGIGQGRHSSSAAMEIFLYDERYILRAEFSLNIKICRRP